MSTDKTITNLIEQIAAKWDEIHAVSHDDEMVSELFADMKLLEQSLADTPADTIAGLAAKAEWFLLEHNFNGGSMDPAYGNGLVFVSMLRDVIKLRDGNAEQFNNPIFAGLAARAAA